MERVIKTFQTEIAGRSLEVEVGKIAIWQMVLVSLSMVIRTFLLRLQCQALVKASISSHLV